jgi:tetratricopeptide (TPR) repeat protein
MFNSYIAIDPSLWWDNQVLTRWAENRFKEAQKLRASVYISLANNADVGFVDPKIGAEAARRFTQLLESAAPLGVRSTHQYFEAEDHGSAPLLSLYHGLLYIFEGYKPSIKDVLGQPSSLNTHFRRVSERLGVTLLPPEAIVNQLGYVMLHQMRNADKAIEFFKLNVANYPDSYHVYDSLGDAYRVKGEKALAIENYEKSLKLKPANKERGEVVARIERSTSEKVNALVVFNLNKCRTTVPRHKIHRSSSQILLVRPSYALAKI